MDGINVISINPGQTTRAAMHPEVFERIARECRLNTPSAQSRHLLRDCVNFVFGLNGKVSSGMSTKLLSLRLIMGAGLISMGAFASSIGMGATPATIAMTYGALLITGLGSRVASVAAFSGFCYYIVTSAIGGFFDTINIIPAIIALVSMILGPGFYSCDQLLRRAIIRSIRKRSIRKKLQIAEERLSYKAFTTTNYR